MKSSDACRALIKEFESLHDGNPKTSLVEPMLDPVGIPTIGWGTTFYPDGKRVTMDDKPVTLEQCEQFLSHDLLKFEAAINKLVKVPLTQSQFDALVSFVYNVGEANLAGSTLLKKLNEKCYSCAGNEFGRWVYSHGKYLKGLVNRRHKEKVLFMTGN